MRLGSSVCLSCRTAYQRMMASNATLLAFHRDPCGVLCCKKKVKTASRSIIVNLLMLLVLLSRSFAESAAVQEPVCGGNSVEAEVKCPWRSWYREKKAQEEIITGMRIPRRYFVTQGFGETDEGSGADPFETGSHDLAMEAAGIHNFNLITYTSIIPPESEEISFEDALVYFHHGAVLECVLSEIHGGRGDRVTAGVGHMTVRNKVEGNRHPMGGFAVEYKGHASKETATAQLESSLEQLFKRRFTPNDHEQSEKKFIVESRDIKKAFGTAVAGVCFVDYVTPVYNSSPYGKKEELK